MKEVSRLADYQSHNKWLKTRFQMEHKKLEEKKTLVSTTLILELGKTVGCGETSSFLRILSFHMDIQEVSWNLRYKPGV